MTAIEQRPKRSTGRHAKYKCTRKGCFTPLHQLLVDAGIRTHPTCEPDYPVEALIPEEQQ